MFEHRLLLLAETFPPSIGGIQSYLSGLWGALPATRSFVVASRQVGDRQWDVQRRYAITRAATRAWTYPRWRFAWRAAQRLVRTERIEAVVCGKALFEGRTAERLSAEFGIPYVICTHGTEIHTWLNHRRTRADLLRVLRKAGRVVVVNEPMKKLLLSLGVAERALVKIYGGVTDDHLGSVSGLDEFRVRHHLQGKRVITAAGRLVPRKGFEVLIRAFPGVLRAIPGAHLLVVGHGPERGRLEAITDELGIVGGVTFTGGVSDDDFRRAIAVAEVFALTPYDWSEDPEGFGIVYLEAAAAGKAAVGTRAGGVPEAVLDGQTGMLVPPGDAEETAHALSSLLSDGSLRQRLGTAAWERVSREFRWPRRAILFQGMVHALLTEGMEKEARHP